MRVCYDPLRRVNFKIVRIHSKTCSNRWTISTFSSILKPNTYTILSV